MHHLKLDGTSRVKRIFLWSLAFGLLLIMNILIFANNTDMPKDPPGLIVKWRSPNNLFQEVAYKGKTWYRELKHRITEDGAVEWYWSKKYDSEE